LVIEMKKLVLIGVGCALLLAVVPAFAVQPSYRGPLGNPEEPALRPYKWVWHGLKSFVYQTKESFVRGNMNTPVVGSVETLRGVRRGSFEMVESTYRGGVFAPLPPRNTHAYRELGMFNTYAESDWLLRNTSDFLFTWYLFPVLKVVDHYPVEDDVKVQIRLERAEEIRDARRASWQAREDARQQELLADIDELGLREEYLEEYVEELLEPEEITATAPQPRVRASREAARELALYESRVKRAQRRYVGERADYGGEHLGRGEGNLLRLGRMQVVE